MSSFNTYDNYNSFNDLINRAELLEEKTYKAMVKGANLGPELKKFKTEDGKGLSATSRIKNLILISALVQMDLLDDDVAKTLRKKATSSTYITNTLKDLAPKVHDELFDGDTPGSEAVVKYVQDNIEQLLPFAVKNVTRGEYEKTEVDTEVPDDAEAKELEDEVSAEVRLAKGLMDSEAEKVDLDFDDVDVNIEALDNKEEVAAKIVDLINTTNNLKAEQTGVGFNIEGPVGVFGSEEKVSDQMNRLITKFFPAVREAEIRVTLNTDNEEDYEEGPEPVEPEGPTNEYEEGINEVEDDEDNEFDPDEAHHYPGYDPNRPLTAEQEKRRQEVNAEFKEFLRTNPEIEDNEFDDFDIGPQSDENVPDDYEEVLKAMVTKDKEQFAKNMIEDEESDTLSKIERDISNGMTAKESMDSLGIHPSRQKDVLRKYLAYTDKYSEGPIETGFEDTEDKDLDKDFYDEQRDQDPHRHKGLSDFDAEQRDQDPFRHDDEDEESIVMQPMLETRKTDTSVYLTEQSASDKRNKKTEVKNQSFKERYKPKTHWQLEELRRYGL